MAKHTTDCNEVAARHALAGFCQCDSCLCEGWCTADEFEKIARLIWA